MSQSSQRCALSYVHDRRVDQSWRRCCLPCGWPASCRRRAAQSAPRAARARVRPHLQPRPRRGDPAAAPGDRRRSERPRQPSRPGLDDLAQDPLPARRGHGGSLSRQLHEGERRRPEPARGARRGVQARSRAGDRAVRAARRRVAARARRRITTSAPPSACRRPTSRRSKDGCWPASGRRGAATTRTKPSSRSTRNARTPA